MSAPDAYAKESNTSLILGVIAVFHILALITSGLRFYTRGFIVKNVRREDYVIAASTVRPPPPPIPKIGC